MNPATFIFVLTYILLALGENSPRKLDRPTATLLGAVLMVISGALDRKEALAAIDMSTLVLLFGMMALLAVLLQSGLPAWLAAKALRRCRSPEALLAVVVFLSGLAAALMLNDTVCLLGTPLLLSLAVEVGIPPAPFLLALATSANIGSVMTLTGNPQNMIIAHASDWSWSGFALRMAPVGLICLGLNWLMCLLLFRKTLAPVRRSWPAMAVPEVTVQWPMAMKTLLVFSALIASFLLGAPLDIASLAAAIALLLWLNRPPREALDRVDWSLILFFASLFVVVRGFLQADTAWLGVVKDWLKPEGSGLLLADVLKLSLVTVAGSNLFSNVPFVIIVGHWVPYLGHDRFLWLLLALTSTLAGNLTLFGSVANLIVAQGAQGQAHLGFWDFLRLGLPVTLLTTLAGVLLLWAFWLWGWV